MRGEKDCRSETIYYFILVVKVAFVTRNDKKMFAVKLFARLDESFNMNEYCVKMP